MLKADISDLRKKGMTNDRFITRDIERIEGFSALSRLLGTAKALQVGNDMAREIAPEVLAHIFPPPRDFKTFDDPFEAFKQYYLAHEEGAERTGCHQTNIVDNTDNALRVDVTHCAFDDLAKQLGIREACLLHCHAHDAALPTYLKEIGITYNRAGALPDGVSACVFRFQRERVK